MDGYDSTTFLNGPIQHIIRSSGGLLVHDSAKAIDEEVHVSNNNLAVAASRRHQWGNSDSNVHWLVRKETTHTRCDDCRCYASLHARNNSPRIFTRSFMSSEGQTAMGLGGFRVVEGLFGKHVEYEVICSSDTHTYRSWRSHDDFVALVRSQCMATSLHMKVTNKKWSNLLSARRMWSTDDLKYLMRRFTLLSEMVESFFFEVDEQQCMLDFASDRWSNSRRTCDCGCTRR